MKESIAVWELDGLTREPDDPILRGYGPGHHWYYVLGGRPLTENKADFSRNCLGTTKLPKEPDKRKLALLRLKAKAKMELAADIERYEEFVTKGTAALS